MKIVFINPSLNCGGAEKVISELANHWSSKNHEIWIITTNRSEKSHFELNEKIIRIAILKGLSSSPINYLPRKITGLYRIRKSIQKIDPHVVYAFQEETSIYTLLSLLGTAYPVIAAVRNHPGYKKLNLFFSFLRKILYPKAHKIVVQTQMIKEWFEDKNYNGLQTIMNPLNCKKGNRKFPREKIIYSCGRLVPAKGFHALIDIFAEIAGEFEDWTLKIIGDGPQKAALKRQISSLGLNNRIIITGCSFETTNFQPGFK